MFILAKHSGANFTHNWNVGAYVLAYEYDLYPKFAFVSS